MREGWEMKKLGEVCEIITRGISPKYSEDKGLIVLNQKCIRDHKISFENSRFHDDSSKRVSFEKIIRKGDVLINSTGTGTLGRVAQVKDEIIDVIVDSHITIVRPLKDIFSDDFFGWALILIEDEIAKRGEGCGGQTELARNTLKNEFIISFPKSLSEQQQIVSILDKIFAAIDEAKANTEKNLKNAKELFQSQLNKIFSEKGEGWSEKKLEEVALQFGRGKSKHRPRNDQKLYGGKFPFIQTGDVRNSNRIITDYSQTYNDVGLAQSKLWPKGTICITIAANIAETAILNFDSCFPDSIIGLVVDSKKANVDFAFYALQFLKVKLQLLGKGSAQDNINLGTFENQTFPFPSLKEQQKITFQLNALSAETKKLEALYQQKLVELEDLKKSILEKAFKGELTEKELAV